VQLVVLRFTQHSTGGAKAVYTVQCTSTPTTISYTHWFGGRIIWPKYAQKVIQQLAKAA